jgi:general secretion pathway protein J
MKKSGFTLVEILVALTIFAVLSLLSYRALSSLLDTRAQLDATTALLRDQSLFFARLENDLASIMARPAINADNQAEPALLVTAVRNSDEVPIRFTRAGFASAMGEAAAPQRVGYRLREGKIELMLWDGIDMAPRANPRAYTALRGVRELRLRVLATSNSAVADAPLQWQTEWNPSRVEDLARLPRAVEVSLTLDSGQSITRLYALRDVKGAR